MPTPPASDELDAGALTYRMSIALTLAQAERRHIERVLADVFGNISRAAVRLGLHRHTLQRKLRRWR